MREHTGVSMSYGNIWYNTPLIYTRNIMEFKKILNFSKSDYGKFKLKVIEFHTRYGTKATCDAFGISKPTIYRWKGIYKDHGRDNISLIPKSRRPNTLRSPSWDIRIIQFIKDIRKDHRNLGKYKIKPLLDIYCNDNSIPQISVSLIGKIIKRENIYYQRRGRYYHNPNHKRPQVSYKSRVKRSPRVSSQGHIEIDTIVRFVNGLKLYIINAVDIYARFEFAYSYKTLTSKNGSDLLDKLFTVYPGKIHTVQTDNGLEFHKYFHTNLEKRGIKHVYIYPRCPKINGYIERCNRSLSEEFIEDNLNKAYNLPEFNRALIDHLIWYNTDRVHSGLKNLSPINFILNLHPKSHMYVTHTNY